MERVSYVFRKYDGQGHVRAGLLKVTDIQGIKYIVKLGLINPRPSAVSKL